MAGLTSSPRRLDINEAKRWLRSPVGYEAIESMIEGGELRNETHAMDEPRGEQTQPAPRRRLAIQVGKHVLILNYTDRCLEWQDR